MQRDCLLFVSSFLTAGKGWIIFNLFFFLLTVISTETTSWPHHFLKDAHILYCDDLQNWYSIHQCLSPYWSLHWQIFKSLLIRELRVGCDSFQIMCVVSLCIGCLFIMSIITHQEMSFLDKFFCIESMVQCLVYERILYYCIWLSYIMVFCSDINIKIVSKLLKCFSQI